MYETLTISVGRDYRLPSGYEFVIFAEEEVVARTGNFKTAAAARRAAVKTAEPFLTPAPFA